MCALVTSSVVLPFFLGDDPQGSDSNNDIRGDTTQEPTNHYAGFVGHIDRVGGQILEGWAQIPFLPHLTAEVEIQIDDTIVGHARANSFRDDLRVAGIRDGFAAFQFTIPLQFCDGKKHRITVRERLSRQELGGDTEFELDLPQPLPHRSENFLSSTILADYTAHAGFANAVRQRKKLAILSMFSPDNLLYGSHHRLIEAFQAAGFAVLLGQAWASDKFIERDSIPCPQSKADGTIIRENQAYDFGTWFACLSAVREHLPHLDELLFVNDSVFGPLFDINALIQNLSVQTADVVGICDSYEHTYHLQSFFLLFRKAVLSSGVIDRFADTYPYSNHKDDVVRDGELALTPALLRAGFKCAALFSYEELAKTWLTNLPRYLTEIANLPENASSATNIVKCNESEYLLNLARHIRRGDPLNPSHAFWDVLLEKKCPFIKRELLFKNPTGNPMVYRAGAMIEATAYPRNLILESARHFGTRKVFV